MVALGGDQILIMEITQTQELLTKGLMKISSVNPAYFNHNN